METKLIDKLIIAFIILWAVGSIAFIGYDLFAQPTTGSVVFRW